MKIIKRYNLDEKYIAENLPIPLGCFLKNTESIIVEIIEDQTHLKDYIFEKEMQKYSEVQTNLFSLKNFLISQNLREKIKLIINQESFFLGIRVIDIFESIIIFVFKSSALREKMLYLSIYLKVPTKNKKSYSICKSLGNIFSCEY